MLVSRKAQILKSLSIASGALSIASGVYSAMALFEQLQGLPIGYLYVSAPLTAVALGVFAVAYRKYDHLRPAAKAAERADCAALYQKVMSMQLYRTRFLRDEAEVRAVSAIDDEAYGDGAIGAALLVEWWNANPNGVLALTDANDMIVGAVGMWPLRPEIYSGLRNGEKSEDQIRGTDIVPPAEAKHCATWYLAGVVVVKGHTKPGAVFVLICNLVNTLAEAGAFEEQGKIEVLSISYSDGGLRLSRRFGFNILKAAAETCHGYDVCLRTFRGADEMLEALDRVVKTRRT